MKARAGFVSNSSTSSFIIGSKEPLTREFLKKMASVPEGSFLHGLVDDIIEIIVDSAGKPMTLEEYLEDRGMDEDELDEDTKKIFDRGMLFYSGGFSSESDDIEVGLCNKKFDIDLDDFVFKQDGGY